MRTVILIGAILIANAILASNPNAVLIKVDGNGWLSAGLVALALMDICEWAANTNRR